MQESNDYKPNISLHQFKNYTLVGLPSELCFVVKPDVATVSRSFEQITYDLESLLLIPAEDIAFDLCSTSEGTLAIAIDATMVRSHCHSEGSPDSVISVCPSAFLAAHGWMQGHSSISRQSSTCLALVNGRHSDVLLFKDSKVVDWRFCRSEDVISTVFRLTANGNPLSESDYEIFFTGELGVDFERELNLFEQDHKLSRSHQIERSKCQDLVQVAVQRIGKGLDLPLINFCNGPLSIVDPWKPSAIYVYAWLTTLAILVFVILAGLYYRKSQYESQTQRIDRLQQDLFRELFPEQKIPAGILSRMESELRRLRITKSPDLRPKIESVLPVSLAFWHALPSQDQVRFQIQSLKLEGNNLRSLEGIVGEFSDLDQFRSGFELRGFTLPPITTKSASKGVAIQWSSVQWTPSNYRIGQEGESK